MNLFLIGYRGTGKSTVAQLLASRLGWEAVDADIEVEQCAGKSIAAIFEEQGEAGFRELESQVLTDLCRRQQIVVGVGGGGVLRSENRERLNSAGKVIWLKASVESIAKRLSGDSTTRARRPNLTNAGGLTEIRELLEQRTPIYRQCADLEVDTEGKSPDEVADEIVARLDLQQTH